MSSWMLERQTQSGIKYHRRDRSRGRSGEADHGFGNPWSAGIMTEPHWQWLRIRPYWEVVVDCCSCVCDSLFRDSEPCVELLRYQNEI